MKKQLFDISTKDARKKFVHHMLSTATLSDVTRLGDTTWTVGVLNFADGWSVQGNAVCVNPADYSRGIAEEIITEDATEKAKTHYWRTVGYMALIGMTEVEIPITD